MDRIPRSDSPFHSYDRAFLLHGSKRNEVLTLAEVERYGLDSFVDADYVSIYGMPPREWHCRGIRLVGRTAVECTRDAISDRIGLGQCSATEQCFSFWMLSSLGAVVERRLLGRRNRGVVAPARGLLLEVVLRCLHETGVGQQVEPGESDCLGRNKHSVLADAHPRCCCRLPRVRRTSRHERRRRESNGRHVPADVAHVS